MRRRHELQGKGFGKNLKMNDDTYTLRRKVMKYVYEARELCDRKLPRVNVRITETHFGEKEGVLGVAKMDSNVAIFIPLDAFDMSESMFRHIVYHEMAHTIFGVRHNSDAKSLMFPEIPNTKSTKAKVQAEFKKYWKAWLK